MQSRDLVLDAGYMPDLSEISEYINEPARTLWNQLHYFLQQHSKSEPKVAYSVCSGKPGWNIKYKKSGKALATLYPEKDGFVVLVVILLDMIPLVEMDAANFDPVILEIMQSARPFNGTVWLMLPVDSKSMLNSVFRLLELKMQMSKTK